MSFRIPDYIGVRNQVKFITIIQPISRLPTLREPRNDGKVKRRKEFKAKLAQFPLASNPQFIFVRSV